MKKAKKLMKSLAAAVIIDVIHCVLAWLTTGNFRLFLLDLGIILKSLAKALGA